MAKRRHLSKMIALTIAAMLLMAITACGGEDPTSQPPANPNPIEDNVKEPVEPVEEPKYEIKQGTGTYVGQIDNNSVEIETADGPSAFRLGVGMDQVISKLQGDESVSYEYWEQPIEGEEELKQLILTKLTVVEGGGGTGSENAQLPATQDFELELEGMKETKTAKLAKGDGYALYIFDIFSFDAKTNKLTMNVDPDYYVEITKLPSDYNEDELKREAEKELAEAGKVREAGNNEKHKGMEDASVYMIGEGESLTQMYIVDEIDGQGYIFRVNNPHREPSEGFATHAFTSLSSIVNQ
ncbi:hypothetical protein ABES58_04285 [Paenibacillus lautus]|uniref:hypothetical protein n=1 Tax=Paenibacillus lautus TaxID=1401 RepID=UPI003D2E35A5